MSFDARYRWTENKLTAGAITLADYTSTSDDLGNITGAIKAVADLTKKIVE